MKVLDKMIPVDVHSTPNGTYMICSHTAGWKDDNTVDRLFHYVDGCGQLCSRCYQTLYAEGSTVVRDGIRSKLTLEISHA